MDLFKSVMDLDKLIAMSPVTRTATQTKSLPLSLAAAALTKYAYENPRRHTTKDFQLNSGKSTYRAAMAFVYAYITRCSDGRTIDAAELRNNTYTRYTIPHGLTEKQWKELIDRALGICFNNRGLLAKVSKGIYMPLSMVQLNKSE